MKGGSILKERRANMDTILWEIESIELGAVGEIGVVKVTCLTRSNTIDNVPESVSIPATMVSAMVDSGILQVFNPEPQ